MPTTLQVHRARHRTSGYTEYYEEGSRMSFYAEEYLPRLHLSLLREQVSIKILCSALNVHIRQI